LRFSNDGDGTGELHARAEADGFAGESGAYFHTSELEEFANTVGTFLLPVGDKRLSVLVTLEVVTTHEPLAKFSRDLDAVLRGKLKEAVLEGASIS
jgi:hypothetical protein